MKNCTPGLLKQAISLFMEILKAKSSAAVKNKANAVKTRFIIFKLLHDKNALIGTFPHKKNELLFEEEKENCYDETIILHAADDEKVEYVEQKYNDHRYDAQFVRDFEEFELEDEIDRAADVFIKKFRMEMMIQKQESFKMYQDMLA